MKKNRNNKPQEAPAKDMPTEEELLGMYDSMESEGHSEDDEEDTELERLSRLCWTKKGPRMTLLEFADRFFDGDVDNAERLIDLLAQRKQGGWVEDEKNDVEKLIDKTVQAQELIDEVDKINDEKNRRARTLLSKGDDTRDCNMDFGSQRDAQNMVAYIRDVLKVDRAMMELGCDEDTGIYILYVSGLGESDLVRIKRAYTVRNSMQRSTEKIDYGVRRVADVTGDVANEVVVPVAEILIRGTGHLLKHGTRAIARIGAATINTGVDVAKDTVNSVRYDDEVLKLRANVRRGTEKISGSGNGFGSSAGFRSN